MLSSEHYVIYDDGIRTSKTVNGATTTYLYDGSVLIAEYAPNYRYGEYPPLNKIGW